jgi:hypothetical protein
MTLPKLTKEKFESIKSSKKDSIVASVYKDVSALQHRKDMEDVIFSEHDVTDDFLREISENYSTEGEWDEYDLIEWIRDIQHDLVEQAASSSTVSLESYIDNNFASQADFAKKQGVLRPQVTQWIKKDFVVTDDVLYSPRRELNR